MSAQVEEWFKQADYDMDTADIMFENGRYFYAVFMCHLSIEKALKGLYLKVHSTAPPKTHNLLYLLNNTGKRPGRKIVKFVIRLNTASVSTRYPDELKKIQTAYSEEITEDIITRSKEVLKWIKTN